MAVFADQVDLRVAVSEWVDRRDISDVMPRFIQQAEATLNRILRTRENLTVGATLTFTNSFAPLPADFSEVKTIWDTTNLYPLSGAESKEVLQGSFDVYSFAIDGSKVFIDGLTGTRLMDYYSKLVSLTTSDTATNWLLQRSPMLYQWAVCLEAAKWLKNSELAGAALELFTQEKNRLYQDDASARYGNAQIRRRASTP